MSFSYDLSTDVGKIRLLIPDNKEYASTDSFEPGYVFEDDELQVFFDMEDSLVRPAVALALDTMASNEVFVLKYIETMDLKTNGPAVSAEMRKRADALRAQQAQAESREDGGSFDIAEMIDTSFQARERFQKQWLRGAI